MSRTIDKLALFGLLAFALVGLGWASLRLATPEGVAQSDAASSLVASGQASKPRTPKFVRAAGPANSRVRMGLSARGYWQSDAEELELEVQDRSAYGQLGGRLEADPESGRQAFRRVLDELDAVIIEDSELSRAQRKHYHRRLTMAYGVLSKTEDEVVVEQAFSDMQLRLRQLELYDHKPSKRAEQLKAWRSRFDDLGR